ncbi:MAG: hypothetical protein ACLFRI_07755 [Candidatus Izemoplasmataceae bacterium]
MFEKESMISFQELGSFIDFYKGLRLYNNWTLQTGLLNKRGNMINDRPYTLKLKNIFNEKKLFRRSVSIAEIVSWLDSYEILKRIILKLNKELNYDKIGKITLYQEYLIRLSKARRVDYIFVHKNNILLVEFRLSDHFPNMSNAWQKKELELIIYKELIKNYLSDCYNVYTYAFIMMPEYDNKIAIEKNIKYNNANVEHFCEYLISYLLE